MGFLWKNGKLTWVGQDLQDTWVFGINRAGRLVGFYSAWTISGPFRWEKGKMYPLPGGGDHFPLSINDRGQIVGYFCDGGCIGLSEVTVIVWDVGR